MTLTDPAVLVGDAGALRDVLVGSYSCFNLGAFFGEAFGADAGAMGAVFFEEGAPFDFTVAILVRREGAALFTFALFFTSFTFFSRLTEPVDFRGAGAGSDFGFAFETLFCFSSVVGLLVLLFFFSAAVDLVIVFCFASLICFSFFARCAELVVGFFGTSLSLFDRAFLGVPLDALDFFEDEADRLALDVEAALEVDTTFSTGLLFVFTEEVSDGLSLAKAVETRALVAVLGLLLSLKGLLFFAFVSADFLAAATFTFSAMDCGWLSAAA